MSAGNNFCLDEASFESGVYPPEIVRLMRDAFEAAWPKARLIENNLELTRQMLASSIVDQVDGGGRTLVDIATAAVVMLVVAKRARLLPRTALVSLVAPPAA
jgi:hypothetical protein